ncbi:MAG: T9SS type A sorting domain-containing protein [Flavitalea sp.]
MKAIITLLLLVHISAQAQVISKFAWTSTPLTTAVIGANGISVSTSATADYIGGTLQYAINPGLPTKNVDLILTGSPQFDINDIDIDLYFRREEIVASFFKRGALFNFEMRNSNLNITFTTTQGITPGNITITSGNIFAIPDDHTFHHYRFTYDNNTGIGKAYVDGTVVYTYTGFAGRPLAWTGAGNVIIGENMDATSRNIAVLSNLTVQHVSSASLPVTLIKFAGESKNNKNVLQWSTTNETGFSHFVVERSSNGLQFSSLKTVNASSAYTSIKEYLLLDESPVNGANYYRLKMVDADNSSEYSPVIKIESANIYSSSTCFPNPAVNFVNLVLASAQSGIYTYTVTTLQGSIVKAASVTISSSTAQVKVDLSGNVPSGLLIIRLQNSKNSSSETFRVVKS